MFGIFLYSYNRYIRSECKAEFKVGKNVEIQIHAIEILLIFLEGGLTKDIALLLYEMTLEKLLYCIHNGKLELQMHLLKLLKKLMVCLSGTTEKAVTVVSPTHFALANIGSDVTLTPSALNEQPKKEIENEITFVSVLSEALTSSINRNVMQFWLDFCLSSLNLVRNSFKKTIMVIIQVICEELIKTKDVYFYVYGHESLPKGSETDTSGSGENIVSLLFALENIVMFCLTDPNVTEEADMETKTAEGGVLRGLADWFVASDTSEAEMLIKTKVLI